MVIHGNVIDREIKDSSLFDFVYEPSLETSASIPKVDKVISSTGKIYKKYTDADKKLQLVQADLMILTQNLACLHLECVEQKANGETDISFSVDTLQRLTYDMMRLEVSTFNKLNRIRLGHLKEGFVKNREFANMVYNALKIMAFLHCINLCKMYIFRSLVPRIHLSLGLIL